MFVRGVLNFVLFNNHSTKEEERIQTILCHWSLEDRSGCQSLSSLLLNLEQFIRPLEPACRIDKV